MPDILSPYSFPSPSPRHGLLMGIALRKAWLACFTKAETVGVRAVLLTKASWIKANLRKGGPVSGMMDETGALSLFGWRQPASGWEGHARPTCALPLGRQPWVGYQCYFGKIHGYVTASCLLCLALGWIVWGYCHVQSEAPGEEFSLKHAK